MSTNEVVQFRLRDEVKVMHVVHYFNFTVRTRGAIEC